MKDKGFTLIELLVVVSIIGILVAAFGIGFQGWRGSYNMESQVKTMYTDLVYARARAMDVNRYQFVLLVGNNSYSLYDDTNPPPDGNMTLETGADKLLFSKPLTPGLTSVGYVFNWTGPGNQITFSTKGLVSPSGQTLWFDTVPAQSACCASNTCSLSVSLQCINPDYNCIYLDQTRINMGKWIVATQYCQQK